MSMSLGVAIVGAGRVGAKRAKALPGGVECRTVFDATPERARAVAASIRGAVASETLEGAIEAPGVSLVIVATSNDALAPVSVAALERGRHVLVEKPGADSLEGLVRIRDAAARAQCRARVGFNHRFHPALLRTYELVSSGQYGSVFGIRGRYGHGGRVGYEQEWRTQRVA
jgi:predicted dehydrogenase